MELFNYLLKVSACTAVFFAFYLLILRRLTFFKINRFYLLFTLLLSFIIPNLNFTIEREIAPTTINQESITTTPIDQISLLEPLNFKPNDLTVVEESFDWLTLLPYCYFAIVCCILLLAVWRIAQLFKQTRNNVVQLNGLKIITKASGFTNCSFFNYVFVDDQNLTSEELAVLLQHEEIHAKQLHSIDKVILIVAKAILWFNPIVYLIDKALEQVHEYEADALASKKIGATSYASLLLRLAVSKSEMPLVHNFVKSPIKERIKMLFHTKSKNMKKFRYLLALPIGLGLLWGFTVKYVDITKTVGSSEKDFTIILDAGHGGKNRGAVVGSYAEKDVALAMTKKIKAIAEAKGIKVVTTRDGDESVSLQERLKFKGNALISLHVNSMPEAKTNTKNGIEMYVRKLDGTALAQQSNLMRQYIGEALQNFEGMQVAKNSRSMNLMILREANIPSVVLELGYLTNENDLKIITNEAKQQELAARIVNGLLIYKNNLNITEPQKEYIRSVNDDILGKTIKGKVISIEKLKYSDVLHVQLPDTIVRLSNDGFKGGAKIGEEITITFGMFVNVNPPAPKGEVNKFVNKPGYYIAHKVVGSNWEFTYNTNKLPFLHEANRVRVANTTIRGIKVSKNGILDKLTLSDGIFILKFNVAQLKISKFPFKIGDDVNVKFIGEKKIDDELYESDQLIALYALAENGQRIRIDYSKKIINPNLYPKFYEPNGAQKIYQPKNGVKTVEIKSIPNLIPTNDIKPKLLSSKSVNIDLKSEISYIQKGLMKIAENTLEAEEIAWDQRNQKLTAKNGKLKFPNEKVVEAQYIIYDLKKNTYITNKTAGNNIQTNSAAYELLSKLEMNNGVVKNTVLAMGQIMISGNVKLKVDGYLLDGLAMTVNQNSNLITAHNASITTKDGIKVNGDVLEFDVISKNYKVLKAVGTRYDN